MVGIEDAVQLLQRELAEWVGLVNVHDERRGVVLERDASARDGYPEGIMPRALLVGIDFNKAGFAVENRQIGAVREQTTDRACVTIKLIPESNTRVCFFEVVLPRFDERQDVILSPMSVAPDPDMLGGGIRGRNGGLRVRRTAAGEEHCGDPKVSEHMRKGHRRSNSSSGERASRL